MSIVFDHVSAAYGKKIVFEDISFTVTDGMLTMVIGRNGAGKSTLAGCLVGEKQDYSGKILLDGKELRDVSGGERARKLAYLPQILPHPHVTVRELVAFGRTPYSSFGGRLSRKDWEIVDQSMEMAGMQELSQDFVDRLSGGERRKAFFAMTLAQDAPVILLDEPTAHLDIASRFEFMESLIRLKGEKTFLVIMHELPEVLRCADDILVLHEHKLIFQGDTGRCLEERIPQKVFHIDITGDRENGYGTKPL